MKFVDLFKLNMLLLFIYNANCQVANSFKHIRNFNLTDANEIKQGENFDEKKQYNSNDDNFMKIIQEQNKLLSKKEDIHKEKIYFQSTQELKSQMDLLTKKTSEIENKLKNSQEIISIQKNLAQDKSIIDTYLEQYLQIEEAIDKLSQNISKFEDNISLLEISKNINAHLKNIKSVDTENIQIGEQMSTSAILASEAKIENEKIIGEYIILEENFQLTLNKKTYSMNDIIHWHSKIRKFINTCGQELQCFISIEEEKEKREKEYVIMTTIHSIENHLQKLIH